MKPLEDLLVALVEELPSFAAADAGGGAAATAHIEELCVRLPIESAWRSALMASAPRSRLRTGHAAAVSFLTVRFTAEVTP